MPLDPHSLANLLIAAFLALETLQWRRGSGVPARTTTDPDRGTTAVLVGCYGVVVLVLNWPGLPAPPLPLRIEWGGIAVAVGGLTLRGWAIMVMRRHATDSASPSRVQHVIRRGPYRIIRHPAYLGSLAMWLGATAASGNVIALVSLTVVMLSAYAVRISSEEASLRKTFGGAYEAYRQQSWCLIPFVY
jgi:protein-S-isoprenylcysteine O-methyltransferase Ste14